MSSQPTILETVLSNRHCDDPFGAVRLALGPSYYTPDANTETEPQDTSKLEKGTNLR